jgi:CRP-like cAMP-binding protein
MLRTVVDPVPGPAADFHLRVLEQRAVAMPTALIHTGRLSPEELAGVLPELSRAQLAQVATRFKPRTYAAGATILREGDPADNFYILMAGEVAVVKRTAPGPEKELARLGAGTYFGEIGLLHGVPRTATVRALTPVKVLVLDRESFLGIVTGADLTSAEIARVVRQRYISAQLAASLPTLPVEAISGLAPDVELRRYPAGAEIIRQGDSADHFYVIARGQVEVVNHHPSGRDILLAERGPGEFFGEAGLLQGRPRTATVRATGQIEVEVLELGRLAFQRLVAAAPATGEAIALTMLERLADTLAVEESTEESASG